MNISLRRLGFSSAHLGLLGWLVGFAACNSQQSGDGQNRAVNEDSLQDAEQACDGQGRAAIEVSLKDAVSGAPVCDGSVHFVGQDTDEMVSCFQSGGGNHTWCGADCSYLLYAEPSRNYLVQSSAAGYSVASVSVHVPSDNCGKPVTQQVTLELQPN